jgi:hypothetical protein
MNHCPRCTRRRFIGSGLALGVGLLLPGLADAGGLFHTVQGAIRVNGRLATPRTRIHPDARLDLAPGASASLVMGDNAFLLKSGARVKLIPQTGAKAAISGFRLLSGGLLGVFGPGPKKLITTTATIGIRGTGVYFESGKEDSYICLCYGALDLEANQQPGQPQAMKAAHHDARSVTAKGEIASAAMINHTDEELIMLEGLVNRKPPFLS